MTATVEMKLKLALETRVATLPVSHQVIWRIDGPVSPPTSGGLPAPYIEAHHLPNRNERPFIGANDPHYRHGILQLTLCWPVANIGSGSGKVHRHVLDNTAGQIAAHFPTDHPMYEDGVLAKVEKWPDIDPSYRDEPYIRIPVSVRWHSFA